MPRQKKQTKATGRGGGKSATTTAKSKPSVGMTVQEAGKRGGEAVKKKYGPEFYSQIGQKGGEKIQAEAKRFRELKEMGKI